MYKVYFILASIAVILLFYFSTSKPAEPSGEISGTPNRKFEKSKTNRKEPMQRNRSQVGDKTSGKKSSIVISRPVLPTEDKIPSLDEKYPVNEHGVEMRPEGVPDHQVATPKEEFNEEEENPADFEKIPQPEDLEKYHGDDLKKARILDDRSF